MNAVRSPGGARVADLARATGTSLMTIRRDLAALERQGVLRRTHGGAVSSPARGTRLPFAVRLDTGLEQKQAIATAVAALVPDGSSVILDNGTTCTAVAQALTGRDLTVLALSVHAAAALGECPGVRIITPGGQLDGDELAWTGHRAVREVQEFRADVAVLGVCAWDEPSGLTATSMHDAEIKKAILASANQAVAVTTADKFGSSATFAVCSSDVIDTLVTSELARDDHLWLTAAGVKVLDQDA
ncbi:DeoR/GlpR family DNA-binding transcription regulator [Myceligenerans crystallogenes]|uniref:DeoR/GlpR family DNA-binding transcription regulator n=2 Tax=Myceligenerans crystallogenes TaxID=316335 RepID=A0ABN2NLJ1_9MICO